jgi:hypothetical protein
MNKKARCKNCRYWKGPIPYENRYCPAEEMLKGTWGYCKRRAPNPVVENVEIVRGKTYITVWPETQAEDVCGEFALIPLQKE